MGGLQCTDARSWPKIRGDVHHAQGLFLGTGDAVAVPAAAGN